MSGVKGGNEHTRTHQLERLVDLALLSQGFFLNLSLLRAVESVLEVAFEIRDRALLDESADLALERLDLLLRAVAEAQEVLRDADLQVVRSLRLVERGRLDGCHRPHRARLHPL